MLWFRIRALIVARDCRTPSLFAGSTLNQGPFASRHLRLSSISKQFLFRNLDFLKEMGFFKFYHFYFIFYLQLWKSMQAPKSSRGIRPRFMYHLPQKSLQQFLLAQTEMKISLVRRQVSCRLMKKRTISVVRSMKGQVKKSCKIQKIIWNSINNSGLCCVHYELVLRQIIEYFLLMYFSHCSKYLHTLF